MKLKTILLLQEDSTSASWDTIREGDGWFVYSEANDWATRRSGASIYITEGEPKKMWVKIKTNGLRKPTDTNASWKERVNKHTAKVTRSWVSAARKIHNSPELNEVGNPIQKTWEQCFREAIQDSKVAPYIDTCGEKKISSPICDPVNFTPRV